MSAYSLPTPAAGSVQNNGVLTKFIKQTVDNTPCEMSNGEINYKEKWKGPYSRGKSILSSVKIGDTLAEAHTALGLSVEEFSAPTCPTRNNTAGVWKVKEIRVEQIEAGDHCFVYFTFYAGFASTETETLTELIEKNVWSITWQSYSVSPWYFCKNGGGNAAPWPPSYEESPPTADWSKTADRAAIQAAMNQNPEFKGNFIVYTPDKNVPDCKMYLDAAHTAIQKKVSLDRNAIYHYPIIVHQTVHRGGFNSTYKGKGIMGKDIDYVVTLPSSCPYNLAEDWTWIKIGDNLTQERSEAKQTTTYTRQETFIGMLNDSYDKNYYGNGTFSHDEAGITNGRWKRESI